jgi:hypothetical protein
MTDWLRRAGRGRDAEGWWVVWSIAEGSRGRRWREVRHRDGAVAHSLLLETDPDGRFSHLELSTASGLLTLHPEPDGTLHGNVVTLDGIEHIRGLAWTPDSVVIVEGSTISLIAASIDPSRPCVLISLGLRVDAARVIGEAPSVAEDGLPVLDAGRIWPLEA